MVVNEHERNLAKGTLHELPPLTVKRSNYTHISSPDAFGGSIHDEWRNVRPYRAVQSYPKVNVYSIVRFEKKR